MKRLSRAVLLLVGTMCAQEVKHAPTVEQCRADAALWGETEAIIAYHNAQRAFVEEGTPNRTDLARLSFEEIRGRTLEMYDCFTVDQNNERYLDVQQTYGAVMNDREHDFIQRHHLWGQLLAEDAAGKR